MAKDDVLLEVDGLRVSYGGINAVKGIDFAVTRGAFMSIIGSNGAGKSSALNALAGLQDNGRGSARMGGRQILGARVSANVRAGVAIVPEGRMVAAPLTVRENLRQARASNRLSAEAFQDTYAYVMELFPRLAQRETQLAGSLSGGEQQMLALGRALLTGPELLMLDEPSMGLAPALVDVVFKAIRAIHQHGVTVLLVEQNATLALSISDYAIVLHRGLVSLRGTAAEVADEPLVRESFLS